MSDPSPAAAAAPWLERDVWLACAGPFAFLPSVNTQVYYYPRGHADLQCRGISLDLPSDDAIPCTVSSVQLGYHAGSDDPYALITLQPDPKQGPAAAPEHQQPTGTRYYVKQLTARTMCVSPFTVPKPCADSLFPVLVGDGSQDRLHMLDVHGKTYRFKRSIKNGSNILTAEWNGYCQAKKLEPYMDSIVFIRRADGRLLIGSRRGGGPSIDRAPTNDLKVEPSPLVQEPAEETALPDQYFTVTYYPRQGWPFVVRRKQVDDALQLHWRQRMKVRMTAVDDHELESSRHDARTPASYDGVVSSVKNNKWWKLQVHWEEPPQGKHEDWQGPTIPNRGVNIWQVEAWRIVRESANILMLPHKKKQVD
ncbi:unnamed protein product [Alopecurus aequalis]